MITTMLDRGGGLRRVLVAGTAARRRSARSRGTCRAGREENGRCRGNQQASMHRDIPRIELSVRGLLAAPPLVA